MTIGERIKQRRLELGLSQSELAQRLGYKSKVSVCNAENDRDDMTTTRIKKYAKALEVSPSYLMGWDDEETKMGIHYSKVALQHPKRTMNFQATDEEIKFLKKYRAVSDDFKKIIMQTLETGLKQIHKSDKPYVEFEVHLDDNEEPIYIEDTRNIEE